MQLYHRYLKLPFNFERPMLFDSVELKDYSEFIYFKDEDLQTEPILDFIDSIGLYRIQILFTQHQMMAFAFIVTHQIYQIKLN